MAENSKLLAAICFFLSIIGLIIAYIAFRNDKLVMYYAKQGTVLGIITFIIQWILVFTVVGVLLLPIVYLIWLILLVLGILNALSGVQKPLPLIGGIWK
jgi:uncharacterized membrane protein